MSTNQEIILVVFMLSIVTAFVSIVAILAKRGVAFAIARLFRR